MSKGKVMLYLDDSRLKRMAAEREMSASALVELALDMLEHGDQRVAGQISVPGYKVWVTVDNASEKP